MQELYAGLAELAQRFTVEVDLRVDESPLSRAFMLSDADLVRL